MSITIMAQVWGADLPPIQMLTLMALGDHANDQGTCWPSIKRIAWKVGYSESSVRRSIKKMEESGIITIQKQKGYVNVYTIHISKIERKPYPCQSDTPVIAMTPPPCHSYDTPTPVIAMNAEPSVKPSVKHKDPDVTTSDGQNLKTPNTQPLAAKCGKCGSALVAGLAQSVLDEMTRTGEIVTTALPMHCPDCDVAGKQTCDGCLYFGVSGVCSLSSSLHTKQGQRCGDYTPITDRLRKTMIDAGICPVCHEAFVNHVDKTDGSVTRTCLCDNNELLQNKQPFADKNKPGAAITPLIPDDKLPSKRKRTGVTINLDGTKTYHYEGENTRRKSLVSRSETTIGSLAPVKSMEPAPSPEPKKKPPHFTQQQRTPMNEAIITALGWDRADVNWSYIAKTTTALLTMDIDPVMLSDWRAWNEAKTYGKVSTANGIITTWPNFMKEYREQKSKTHVACEIEMDDTPLDPCAYIAYTVKNNG